MSHSHLMWSASRLQDEQHDREAYEEATVNLINQCAGEVLCFPADGVAAIGIRKNLFGSHPFVFSVCCNRVQII